MKIIDLLNKIANGEEVQQFEYYGGTYRKSKKDNKYWCNGMWFEFDIDDLNTEVEIIEEPKVIPEKLDMVLLGQCDNWTQKYNKDTKKMENTHIELNPYVIDTIRENTLEIQHKFNEIIDYLESKGE